MKLFSLPSFMPDGGRRIELGVRGDPAAVDAALAHLVAGVEAGGFRWEPLPPREGMPAATHERRPARVVARGSARGRPARAGAGPAPAPRRAGPVGCGDVRVRGAASRRSREGSRARVLDARARCGSGYVCNDWRCGRGFPAADAGGRCAHPRGDRGARDAGVRAGRGRASFSRARAQARRDDGRGRGECARRDRGLDSAVAPGAAAPSCCRSWAFRCRSSPTRGSISGCSGTMRSPSTRAPEERAAIIRAARGRLHAARARGRAAVARPGREPRSRRSTPASRSRVCASTSSRRLRARTAAGTGDAR